MKLLRDRLGLEGDRSFWTLVDDRGKTIWLFQDYIIHCVDEAGLSSGAVSARAYSLFKWFRFCAQEKYDVLQPSDALLGGFRDSELALQSSNCHGNLRARMRSVNQTLRCIYLFYMWLQQQNEHGQRQLLGTSGARIRSSLLSNGEEHRIKRYPLLLRRSGEQSKHRLAFVPSDDHRADLVAYFFKKYPPGIAKRNCLMMELAWRVGWRRGSIMSLTVSDFTSARGDETSVQISPARQKFGHQFSFRVDRVLVDRILAYVESDRRHLAKLSLGIRDELFLSATTGLPISAQYVSTIFSRARRELGWPIGAGLHSWRRGFANRFLEREIDARLEIGLDTSYETLSAAVAYALGHESVHSQAAYVRDSQRRVASSDAYSADKRVAALESIIVDLEDKLSRLGLPS